MQTRTGVPELKEFGAHRSGTNFLRVILQENYDVFVLTNTGGWKHGYYQVPDRLGREVDCAICVKDPYAWVTSYHNFTTPEKDVSFAEFARKPISFIGPGQKIECPNPMKFWVQMNEHWLNLELKERRKFILPYEKVLADPIASVQEIVKTLAVPEVHERLLSLSTVPVGDKPEEFARFIRSEHDQWGKVIKAAKIEIQ